ISAGKGAPVYSQLMDPVPSAAGTLMVLKGAKHSHAAMLLTDFILSKEGQEIMAQAEYFPAHPEVEPAPQLASIVPRKAGYTENYVSPQQLKEKLESTDKIISSCSGDRATCNSTNVQSTVRTMTRRSTVSLAAIAAMAFAVASDRAA